MKIFTKSTMVLASALAIGVATADAKLNEFGRVDMTKFSYRIDSNTAFKGDRADRIEALNAKLDRAAGRPVKAKAADGEGFAPDITFGPKHMTGDLDGPHGERWFYVANYDYTVIPPDYDNYIWFTDYILNTYEFEIYDAQLNYVGTVKDKVDYAEDEVRVPSIELAPVISRNFFNTDDKVEVIVGLVVNTTTPGANRYHTYVYSIGGDKENGDDKPIMEYDNMLGDVVEGPATADGKDNFFMSFAEDSYPEMTEEEYSFWEYATGAKMNIVTYGRAVDATGPRKLMEKEIKILNLPGDQESAPFLMSLTHGDDVYFVYSYLEEPLWNRYDDPTTEDMSQREGNKLLVDLYKVTDNGIEKQYTTTINAERDLSSEQNIATFYSIGNLKYKQDVDFDNYGTPAGRAALIVTRENYNPSSDSTVPSYFVYNYNGRVKATLAENCDGHLALTDIPGEHPQHLFIYPNGYSYYFSFVNLLTGEEDFGISSQYSIDPDEEAEGLRANLDRVPVGDSYQYAIELQSLLLNDDEDNIMRLIWLDKDGNFDHFDGVNMGKDVQYAQLYIESHALDPKAFHSDDAMEYLMLIKRGNAGGVLTEEMLLAQATDDEYNGGKSLLLIKPDDARGTIAGIVPDLFGTNPNLTVYFTSGSGAADTRYTQEIYKLPLDIAAGVEDIISDVTDGKIALNGKTVTAEGTIHIYNASGALMLSGKDSLDLSSLSAGIYIIAADGASIKVAL